ncbi:MAG: DUF1330 domain-containing protein [Psychromonas sp.]|nr:DUF1330 domain-containing protein [Alteromonadales bacterium]MCP5077980.1 DUF1330 domain-containing protein [Psychromonas sp.]
MKTLIIVDLTILDKEKLAEYSALAAETLTPFSGQFIAKAPIEEIQGNSEFQVKAVIEFPDKESAKNWYHSEQYQAIIPLREQAIRSQFHLVG